MVPSTLNSQSLRLARHAPDDKPFGVANIFGLLALLLPLLTDDPKAKLMECLGVQHESEILSLKNIKRFFTVILSPEACAALDSTATGKHAKKLWAHMNALFVQLDENLEAQINREVSRVCEIEEMFAPESIVSSEDRPNLIFALLAVETIKVSWLEELSTYETGPFKTMNGYKDAIYCTDHDGYDDGRYMEYFDIAGPGACRVLKLPCKPEEGTTRSMLFALPRHTETKLNDCLGGIADYMDTHKEMLFVSGQKFDFKFPAFDATLNPTSIKEIIAPHVPTIFIPSGALDKTLPKEIIGGPAYIAKIIHGASIKADRKGAEARAVTLATGVVYRSLSITPEPVPFYCDRPFLALLVAGSGQNMILEFVIKVVNESLDMSAKD